MSIPYIIKESINKNKISTLIRRREKISLYKILDKNLKDYVYFKIEKKLINSLFNFCQKNKG